MAYEVDFTNVSTVGLESSPVAAALAGLRANEARYFKNKYDHVFTVEPAQQGEDDRRPGAPHPQGGARHRHRARRRSRRRQFEVEGIRWAYVFYESGLSINVLYTLDDGGSAPSGSSSPTAWTSPTSSRRVQVRAAEVEAGRHDPRLVLRHQGRVLTGPPPSDRCGTVQGVAVKSGGYLHLDRPPISVSAPP